MSAQSYRNHLRFYTPHHFLFYPLLLLLIGLCLGYGYARPGEWPVWLSFAGVLLLLGWLSFMMRQHYALGNQDRIVRLEMRFRYFALTGRRLEPLEGPLSFGQIKALRFASDEELPALLDLALREGLSPGAIKQAIVHWQPDHNRV